MKHMLKVFSPFRLAVLGKLNNFVKEWIAEISELKVGRVACLLRKSSDLRCNMLMVTVTVTLKLSIVVPYRGKTSY